MKKNWFTKKHFIIVGALVVALSITASFLVFNAQTRAPSQEPNPIVFTVEPNETINGVIERLYDEGLIRSVFFTKLVAKTSGLQSPKVGQYTLDQSWDANQVLTVINKGVSNEITVRLPEGGWAKDFAKNLEAATGIPAEDFLSTWNDEAFIRDLMPKYSVLTEDIFTNKKDVRVLLEGYLYPDTYQIPFGSNVDQISEQIINNTQVKYEANKDLLEATTMSYHDVVRLASVVLYEAHEYEDMRMIAGVFMNRLDIDMRLQASTTVCYALYEYSDWRDCEKSINLYIDSPYNTYVNEGLPVGPILNPTQDAIRATLDYAHHDYFFFFSDVESGGTGKVYYTKTYAEHEAKREEVRKQLNGGN